MRKRRRCAAPASVPELSAGAGGDAIAAAFAEQQLLLIRAFCAPPPAVTLRSLAELSRAHSAMVDGTWTLECAGGAPRSAAAWLGGARRRRWRPVVCLVHRKGRCSRGRCGVAAADPARPQGVDDAKGLDALLGLSPVRSIADFGHGDHAWCFVGVNEGAGALPGR